MNKVGAEIVDILERAESAVSEPDRARSLPGLPAERRGHASAAPLRRHRDLLGSHTGNPGCVLQLERAGRNLHGADRSPCALGSAECRGFLIRALAERRLQSLLAVVPMSSGTRQNVWPTAERRAQAEDLGRQAFSPARASRFAAATSRSSRGSGPQRAIGWSADQTRRPRPPHRCATSTRPGASGPCRARRRTPRRWHRDSRPAPDTLRPISVVPTTWRLGIAIRLASSTTRASGGPPSIGSSPGTR